ncbi:hypothetical protein ACS2UZ_27220, partial [Bacillus cereus group sp. BC255]|uniref:hypothetical protein n=1 Tax=Bacillus cereus group sp. BC255 TaxID=3445327 RepID=UPI003F286A45
DRIIQSVDEAQPITTENMDIHALAKEALLIKALFEDIDLGSPYIPASQSCVVLNTQVPDSMSFEIQSALARIKSEIGGSMDNFVRHRL